MEALMKKARVLALDAGGSIVKAEVLDAGKGGIKRVETIFFNAGNWNELEKGVKAIYGEFFAGLDDAFLAACFAGRVADSGKTISVTKWGEPKRGESLFKGLKFSKKIYLNDIEAAVVGVRGAEFGIIQKGKGRREPFSLVYLGSGMGVANDYAASEFGAVALPLDISDPLEKKLSGKGFLRYENLLSGPGLSLLAFKLGYGKLSPEEVSRAVAAGKLKEVGALFAKLFGRACRNLALTTLSDSLVFGGKPLKALTEKYYPVFVREFLRDPVHAWWLEGVSLLVIEGEEELPLRGLRKIAGGLFNGNVS